ncbi:hypothetical protein JVT61DRAFT_6779 [Boletus reticuloceps]|uniref:Uncharacterized protein n=1 Tax=Boletus reticuloceps TaxID=495285 RepID=A0A8I2YKH1_9AGAM|nr:hypothetical protein JVT61DRAFT_6779 [Boletus reticuloceps]
MTGLFGHKLVQKAAQAALNEYLQTHSTLHDEIKNRTGVVHGSLEEVHIDTADADDDVDVPSSAMIRDTFGLQDADIPTDVNVIAHCVESSEKGTDNSLVATDDNKDIWAFINWD